MNFTAVAYGRNSKKTVEEISDLPDEHQNRAFAVTDMVAIHKIYTAKVTEIIPVIINVECGVKLKLLISLNKNFAIVTVKTVRDPVLRTV